ncbi:glycosyltransferase family 4 protein [Nocardia sp. NPDC057030]|uniref:glycosyltransferase family 4 protein n=1 Tax=unclassified Nocardia TaxID=2637762 RepID=UPI0036437669
MHLALLTPEWWYESSPGGIATYCHTLAAQAASLGNDVTVFTAGRGTTPASTDRVRVITVVAASPTPRGYAEAFRDAVNAWIQQGHRLDYVEAADYLGFAALLDESVRVGTRLHTPYTYLLARRGSAESASDREVLDLEKMQIDRSALVTSPTVWLAEVATRLWDLPYQPSVIPNPIQLPTVAQDTSPDPHMDTDSPLRVLYFGHLAEHKGVFTLAHALRSWFDQGADATVSFVSQEAPWKSVAESRMRQILGRHAEPPLCRFLPEQRGEQLQRTIAAADLVVLPSHAEAFGYTVVEAMAHAKPVISTTGAGSAEIIDHGSTGFLVAPGDAGALTDILAEVSTDRAALTAIGQRAQASLTRYSSQQTTARLLDLYTHAIDAGRSTSRSRKGLPTHR